MILHLLQDGIRLKWSLLEYDLNSNVSLAGTPEGPTTRVMLINGFVFVLDCSPFIL